MPDPFADLRARLAVWDRLHAISLTLDGDIFDSDGDEVILVKARYLSVTECEQVAAAILRAPADLDWCVKRIEALEAALCPFTADVRDYYYSDDSPPRCQFCNALLPAHADSCRTLAARRALG